MSMSLLAAVATLVANPPASVTNGDFSSTAGWSMDEQSRSAGYRFAIHRGVARITEASTPTVGDYAVAAQEVDARSWRGRTVALTGRVRLTGKGSAGLRMVAFVQQPERRLLRVASPAARVPADGQWHEVTLRGRVGVDADRIRLGLWSEGVGRAEFDDIRLASATPPRGAMSPEAARQFDKALTIVRTRHVNARGNPNWATLERQARADAAGAQTVADLQPALTALLGDLNEHHASFRSPEELNRASAALAAPAAQPSVSLVEGRYGLIKLPAINVSDENSANRARIYVDSVRAGLARLDASPLCGWIVDLRGNDGGTTHVMLDAISGVVRFDKKDWPDENEGDLNELPPFFRWIMTIPDQPLTQGAKPAAVLIDGVSASAAEDVALHFVGREPTRSFGAISAGFVSANETTPIGDHLLVVPVTYMHDRKGRPAKTALVPDEPTSDPLGAAQRWLGTRCGAS